MSISIPAYKSMAQGGKDLDQITGQMDDMHIDVMDEDDNYV